MSEIVKDKRNQGKRMLGTHPHTQVITSVCEICGQELERDPESGEYFCPTCDDSEHQP